MTIETKLFELRDVATFIPIIASRMRADTLGEAWLLRRAGYSETLAPLVLLTRLDGGGLAEYDPHAWGGRTYPVAHLYIAERWDELRSGDLIDVRALLGETDAPCRSEMTP